MDNSSTFICGRSALEIYRSPADGARLARLLNQEQSRLASPCTQSGCNVTPQAPRRDLASALAEMFGVPLPLEALVCEPGRRRLSTYTRTVLDTDPFHLAAFIEIERGVFVARPELVYYQLTKGATIARAWMLASELCGRYALDSHAETGMRKRPPLTSPDRLASFFRLSRSCRSPSATSRAIEHMRPGARSPKEAELAALIALPRRMGGRGIPGVTLNRDIELSPEAALIARRERLEGDVFIESIMQDVEYDSNAHHLSREAHERDERKANALRMMGIGLTTVTEGQLMSWNTIDAILADLCARGRFHRHPETQGIRDAQQRLWRELLSLDATAS